jgi:hypothetical protein
VALDRKSPSFVQKAHKGWGTLKHFCSGINRWKEGLGASFGWLRQQGCRCAFGGKEAMGVKAGAGLPHSKIVLGLGGEEKR